MSDIRKRTIHGLQIGDTFTVSRHFSEEDVMVFADITGDYNPVHFDARFSGAKNFKARICHGLLVGSILTQVGGQIGWLATLMNFRFKLPVYFDETITCRFTIIDIDESRRARAEAIYFNQVGNVVLEAELEGILPDESERMILDTMVKEGDPTNKVT